MRVVIAMMKHETDTFSPLPTPLASFGRGKATGGPAFGSEAIAMVAGTNNAMAAEAAGEVLNASVFGGFPLSDIPWVGLSVAVVADANRIAAGQALVDELCAMARPACRPPALRSISRLRR